ncbi:MAG: hypothetical protein ACK422_06110, partial [Burkholderiales bacterium]
MSAIQAHQVVIVCGETGSGKTTQLPKMALALGRGSWKKWGCGPPFWDPNTGCVPQLSLYKTKPPQKNGP